MSYKQFIIHPSSYIFLKVDDVAGHFDRQIEQLKDIRPTE